MAEPFVIVNRRCSPSSALPFSFLPPWLFYLLRKQKRSRVSVQGRKCAQLLRFTRMQGHTRLCHPPTSARAPQCHRHEGDTRAWAAGWGGRDAPGICRSIGTAPCKNWLYRSEEQWEEERDASSKVLYQTIVIWGSRNSCISHQVGFEGYFLP